MISWDDKWNNLYAEQGFRGKYPDENVVRFVAGNFFKLDLKKRKGIRILDLGCGPGRHVIFLAKEGFSAFGIEASKEAISLCKSKLKQNRITAKVKQADFISLPYENKYFDAVIDCASIQHNRFSAAKDILREVRRVLKPGGKLFSLLRTNHDYAYGKARKVEIGTFTDYNDLDLKGVGLIHFYTEREIHELFSIFKKFSYEYTERSIQNREKRITHWIVSAEAD